MKRHIIYIPGLGDRYDLVRRLCLLLWRRPGVAVSLVPMAWLDADDSYEQKMGRIEQAIARFSDRQTILVGESAGGSMVISRLGRSLLPVHRTVTVCGMNQGASNVSPLIYRKNPGFRDAMQAADGSLARLTDTDRETLFIMFSSLDFTVRPRHSVIAGADSYDMRIPGHITAIFGVLLWHYRKILRLP